VLLIVARLEVLSTILNYEASKVYIAIIVNTSIRLYNLLSRAYNYNLLGVFLIYTLIL
jgi:hypothetical protein